MVGRGNAAMLIASSPALRKDEMHRIDINICRGFIVFRSQKSARIYIKNFELYEYNMDLFGHNQYGTGELIHNALIH
jgi:hypothetical protein